MATCFSVVDNPIRTFNLCESHIASNSLYSMHNCVYYIPLFINEHTNGSGIKILDFIYVAIHCLINCLMASVQYN